MVKKIFVFLTIITTLAMLVSAFPSFAADLTYTVSDEYLTSEYQANLQSVQLTGDGRTDVVLVALSQLGYHEGDSDADMGGKSSGSKNFVEYNRPFGKLDNGEGNGTSYGYAWCCAFATWCVRQAGVPSDIVTTEVSCHRLINWFKASSKSKYVEASTDYIPQTGDLIFFKNTTTTLLASHVGIVRYCDGKKIYTIEGNTGTYNVATREYDLGASNIVGFGVPAYTSKPEAAIDFSKLTTGTYFITVSSTSSLNVRSEPSSTSSTTKIVGSLSFGDKVTVTELSGTWGKIKYNGEDAWISLSYAQFVPSARYTIYYDVNGGTGLIASQPKQDGKDTTLTTKAPAKPGYRFAGWATTKDATSAKYAPGATFSENADTTLYAVWTIGTFNVSFYNGTTELQRGDFTNGTIATYTSPVPTKPSNNTYTYKLAGWDTDGDGKIDYKAGEGIKVDRDIVAYAVFEEVYINYKVTFVGLDSVISEKTDYHYGDKIEIPEAPTVIREMYEYSFEGWNVDIAEKVTENAVYTAIYTQKLASYKIKFVDGDGKVMSEKEYCFGSIVEVPTTTPTKSADETFTYTFRAWDKELEIVKADATYTATFDRTYIQYKVDFVGDGGVVLGSGIYHYGDTPTVPSERPTKDADNYNTYDFAGWDSEVGKVTGDKVYTAAFDLTPISYTVTFFNDDGIVYKIEEYFYGDTIKLPENPKKSGSDADNYVFAGWTPEVGKVDGNMRFTATYKLDVKPATTTQKPEEPEESGCGSAISAAFVLILIPAAFVLKKKEF